MMNAIHSGFQMEYSNKMQSTVGGVISDAIVRGVCGAFLGVVVGSNIRVGAMIGATHGAACRLLTLISFKVFDNISVAFVASYLSDAAVTAMAIVALRRFDIIGNLGTVVFGFFAGCSLVTAGIAGYKALRPSQNPEGPLQESEELPQEQIGS